MALGVVIQRATMVAWSALRRAVVPAIVAYVARRTHGPGATSRAAASSPSMACGCAVGSRDLRHFDFVSTTSEKPDGERPREYRPRPRVQVKPLHLRNSLQKVDVFPTRSYSLDS